jgi:hypothetical protein
VKQKSLIDNSSELIKRYQSFLSLWVFRICSILIAYLYYGYPGFVVLTWVLLSFGVSLYNFVKMTVFVYLPYFILTFFIEYFFNIQKLFMVCKDEAAYTGCK